MEPNKEPIKLLNQVDPRHSFLNWKQQQSKKPNKWGFEEKRFNGTQLFSSNRRKNGSTDTLIMGPGAGAGVGCGVGFGLGLVGGIGISDGPWNCLRVVFGFGVGCGVGAGFGYGHGFGYGLDWKSIKSELGFKEKKGSHSHKRVVLDY